jgi:glycosyltransferase involved in cell wall biosynthesis
LTVLDIVMPYYGDVGLMQTAVRSVLAQSDDRWRLTVVDDGAEPGVPEWFAGLGHPQVRYERNVENLGILGNFQKCLDLADHDYLVMMGCDDVMLPGYVGSVAGLIERYPAATIIQPGVEVIDGAGVPVRTLVDQTKHRIYAPRVKGSVVLDGEALAVSLIRGNWLYFPSLCWRREAIAAVGFDERLSVIQDLAVVLELVERGGELVVSDELCFQYRRHAQSKSSVMAASGGRFTEARAFFLDVAGAMQARGWERAARAARWHVSSRLHALTMLPGAAAARNVDGMRVLAGHTFGSLRG